MLEAFNRLVRQGKVRFIGCSNTLAWRIATARAISRQHGWAEYCCVQQRHSYLHPRNGLTTFSNGQVPVNGDLLDYVTEAKDFTIIAYSVLLGGVYVSPKHILPANYLPDEYDADMQYRLQILQRVAEEANATPNQVVLAWLMQNTPSMIPLVSPRSQKRLQENLEATDLTLTAELLSQLNM